MDIKDTARTLDADTLMGLLRRRPRVLALGEPAHEDGTLLRVRNDLLRQLVEQQDYRVIALESDCVAGLVVDEYVTGGAGTLDEVMERGFSHGFGAFTGNRELVRWMRARNEGRPASERVRFAGFDGPLEIHCRIDVHGDELTVDYHGSAAQQPQGGLNCTFIYTRGQTSYGLKCILLPDIPSNAGVYRPIAIAAPEGSILNARKPASVQMRTRTGWYIHQALFAALAEVLPEQVMAPAGLLSAWIVYGQPAAEAPGFRSWFFNAGGMGAGAHADGVSTCIYPSSASTVPVELYEVAVPMLVREKALITDSGGAGRQRGGLGQRVTLSLLPGFEGAATVSMGAHGRNFPPFGLHDVTAPPGVQVSKNQSSPPVFSTVKSTVLPVVFCGAVAEPPSGQTLTWPKRSLPVNARAV